jgi:hypothetical protein
MDAIRSRTVDSFEQFKKKSSDALRKISSRPPPAGKANESVHQAPAAARKVEPKPPAEAAARDAEIKAELGKSRGLSRKKVISLAALAAGVISIVLVHRGAKQHHEELENELTQATPLLWSSDLNEVKKISEHLDRSFEVTIYGKLANGVSDTLGLAAEPVFSSLEPEAHVLALRQHAVLRLLDPKADAKKLDALLAAVEQAEVPPERVRFAKLLPLLDTMPADISAAENLHPSLKKEPVALLMSGILLERVGKVQLARQRYQAAAKERTEWHLPNVYATRLALLTQGASSVKSQLQAVQEAARVDPNLGAISRALNALAWAVDGNRTPELPDTGKLAAAEAASLPTVLAQVPELVELVEAVSANKDDVKARLTSAINRADGPALLVQLAGIAASVNQPELVDDAIERVQAFAKGYAPAKALAARMQLSKGDFTAARQTAKAAGLDLSGIDAVEAYELQDAKGLKQALESMPEGDKKKPEYAAVLLCLGVLTGNKYPNAGELDKLLKENSLWVQLIAADAALDQGDLRRARDIIKGWPEGERTEMHQVRVARYERFKGRSRDAVKLSEQALDDAGNSNRALLEHLSALLADDRLQEAMKLFDDPAKKELLKPHGKWADALLLGKDKGWMAANIMASYLPPPTSEDALSLRLLALRAMAVAGDPRAGVYLKRLEKLLPRNPDFLTAKSEY